MQFPLLFSSLLSLLLLFTACTRTDDGTTAPFQLVGRLVDGLAVSSTVKNALAQPTVLLRFSEPLNGKVASHLLFKDDKGAAIPFTAQLVENDTAIEVRPQQALPPLTKSYLQIYPSLTAKSGKTLETYHEVILQRGIDPTPKFPSISDDSLLTLVQKQTFRYFWDFGHPVSGLAPERNATPNVVTSGGSGFGVMSILVGVHRGFITRAEGLARMQKITDFLKNKTIAYHGAFPHWIDGTSGATIPFSQKDDGADLVETSYLMQGLLCARQFFNGTDTDETALRAKINQLWEAVEWDWFTQGGQKVLYWHWSPNYNWQMNHKIQGWNEALITYIMAASSPTHSINTDVYTDGWAKNGAMKNGKQFYGHTLPLGWDLGGPLFFSHYTFLGVDPRGLTDQYADYQAQTRNHSLINYAYCAANPRGWAGYSSDCWGLTASDTYDGYTAHEPNNDRGVISPTAAVSSLPFTPDESMRAIRYFYFVLGDKIWQQYGFVDAFSIDRLWFSNSFLAIDQGPMIVMIENHRSGLLWQLFTSCPEVKAGMKKLGFSAPYL